MRGDHHDAVALCQVTIQRVTVIGSVADQSCREGVEEAVSEDAFNELAVVRRSAFDANGERKTVASARAMIFVPLPRLVGPTARPPFLPP